MSRLEVSVGARVRFPAVERATLIAGLIFFAEAAQFMLVIMLGAAIAPDYSLNVNTISDLGVVPQTAILFNSSLIAVGILNIVGALLFHRAHHRVWITAVFVLAGIGALDAGAINLDISSDIHNLGALVAFIGFGLQPAAAATRLRGAIRLLAVLASVTLSRVHRHHADRRIRQRLRLRFDRPWRRRAHDRLPDHAVDDGFRRLSHRLLALLMPATSRFPPAAAGSSAIGPGTPEPWIPSVA